jgi:hypothetical protein
MCFDASKETTGEMMIGNQFSCHFRSILLGEVPGWLITCHFHGNAGHYSK